MLTYLLIQWRHIVTMSHNTFHSSSHKKRQRRRLANVDIQLRHLVTIRSPNSFHSGHLAITVTLRGPDGDRYGQVLLYITFETNIPSTTSNKNYFDIYYGTKYIYVLVRTSITTFNLTRRQLECLTGAFKNRFTRRVSRGFICCKRYVIEVLFKVDGLVEFIGTNFVEIFAFEAVSGLRDFRDFDLLLWFEQPTRWTNILFWISYRFHNTLKKNTVCYKSFVVNKIYLLLADNVILASKTN